MVTTAGDISNNEKQMVDSTPIQQLNIMEYVYVGIGNQTEIYKNLAQI